MSSRSTSFQGTKFKIGASLEVSKKITACTITPKVTLSVAAHGVVARDIIKITGLGAMDGFYPVKSVTDGVITLSDNGTDDEISWSRFDTPTDFKTATIEKVVLSDTFCTLTSIESDGDTLSEEDVTVVCDEGKVTEAGEIEFGNIKLDFKYKASNKMQALLRSKFHAKETFPYVLEFPNNEGALYGTAFVSTSPNLSGEVLKTYESGVTLKKQKRDYYLA